jgi:hypothetical protein
MSVLKRTTYLIQDPYDDDALKFMRTIFTYFGLRPVCFYTDRKGRFYGERRVPALTSERVEAAYDVDLTDLSAFARLLKERYRVLGVIPYREDTVEPAADLCELLGLDWNVPETVRRFRDKHALKTHVTATDPSVRVPAARVVRCPFDIWAQPLPERFVLKPNQGFGNRDIGIFQREQRGAIERHMARHPGLPWTLEEYISGVEYHINGQVRADGEVTILGLLQYIRTATNDYDTVYCAERQCRTTHPEFERISSYARRLLRATGIRRVPFHLEVKVDERGPCMIDLGARIPSEGGGQMLSRFHPNRSDVFAVAAHDYLGETEFAREPVDWTHYDRELTVLVYGVSDRAGIIQSVSGVEEVDSMPEFVNWVVKPEVGNRVWVTTDLRGAPYIVELRHGGSDDDSLALIERVRSTIRWNQTTSPGSWLRAHGRDVLRRAPTKLRWIAHGVKARVKQLSPR